MDSIVLDLQRDAMGSEIRVTDLLRKALVVARKLGVSEFQKWISSELDGYKEKADIPEYRIIHGEIRAWNPYHGWIPIMIQDADSARRLTTRSVVQSIGELESLISEREGKSHLEMPFPTEIENGLMRSMEVPLRPVLHINASEIHGIIEGVRNTVLNWALKLEEDGVLGQGMMFTEQEKNKAQKATNIVIQNFQGILGDVQQSTISQNIKIDVYGGDFISLSNYLHSLGIQPDDISDLERAAKAQQKPTSKENLGPAIGEWVGRMVAKAASGSWKIAADTAAGLLTRAISAYLGLPP